MWCGGSGRWVMLEVVGGSDGEGERWWVLVGFSSMGVRGSVVVVGGLQ